MATTINSYADGLEDFINSGIQIEQQEGGIRLKRAKADITFASQAAGEDVAVFLLKKGSTLYGGNLVADGTLANSAQISVGLMGADGSGYITADNSTTADGVALLKAAATQGTTLVTFGTTAALYWGYTLEKDCYLTVTTSVGTVATEVLSVFLDYTPYQD